MPHGEGRKSYPKGGLIFEEGKRANGLFCIISGKVKVTRLTESGREQILHLAGQMDVIGHRALLAGDTYKASAVALEEVSVGYVPRQVFLDLISTDPELAMQMLALLSNDLDLSDSRRLDMATKTVRERLAELLLLLKDTYGVKEDGITVDISLSREEIAGIIGAAKEVVIRNLTHFKEEKLIESKGRQIRLLDPATLLNIARQND
jgi:CRP-like cAMP-binding protein